MTPQIRITIIDPTTTISFGAPGYLAKMAAAACGHNPSTVDQVLGTLATLDPDTALIVRNGLARFDEFVVKDDEASVDQWLVENDPKGGTPFRLVDPRLREATLTPLELGTVMLNLPDKRIVQLENRYGALQRTDLGRMRRDGHPIGQLYRYELSDEWSLLP
jgi:hypothetical protein